MRIAYFTETLPPHYDGVVNSICHLIQYLQEENISFQFMSPIKPDNSYQWAEKVKKIFSVPFLLYSDYRVSIPYFQSIPAELDVFNPDLIHVTSPTLLGLYGLNYARSRGIKAVSSYHTNFVSYLSYYGFSQTAEELGWSYLRWFYSKFDCTYVPSPSTGRYLEERGIKRVELWQRGVDLERFSPAFRSQKLRQEIGVGSEPLLLFVGRLVKEKDLDDLVAAHLMLREKHAYKLAIVGDGPMKKELEAALPDAHFAGFQRGSGLSQWYASADLFIFPSTTETFGNVILEAFASGLPVVAVKKGGVADIITDNEEGFLADPHNPVDFAQKISMLLKQPQLRRRMKLCALDTALRYSWPSINGRLMESYKDILSNRN